MNNVKFSSLSVASYLSGSDYITIVRSGSATQSDTGIAPNNYIVQAQYFTSSWANNARTSSYFDADTLFLRQGNILAAAGLNLTMGNNSSMAFYGNNSLMARFVGADGNFGIGSGFATASPTARLHVSSSVTSFPGGHHNNLKLDALNYPTIWFNRTEDNTGFLNAMDYNGFNISSVSSGTPTQRLTINSAGKVGIGTTSPSAKLHVVSADNNASTIVSGFWANNETQGIGFTYQGIRRIPTTGNASLYLDGAGNNHVLLQTIATGNVGIGTTNPLANLDVGASAGTQLFYNNTTLNLSTTPILRVSSNNASNATQAQIGISLSNTSATNNTYSPVLAFSRRSTSGMYNTAYAEIAGIATGDGASSDWVKGVLTFLTAPVGNVGPIERMRIDEAGYVGIGTTSPSHQLTLSTDSAKKPTSNVWDTVSDERIKTDIVPADLSRCYEIVKQVGLKHFGFKPGVYNDGQIKDKHTLGFIAQDVQKVFGKAVSVSPFTLQTDIPNGIEEYEEQDFTLETVDKVETSIQVLNGKPVQVSKVVTSENKVMLFDMVDVLDESGVAVMESYEVTPAIRAIDATEEVEAVESIEAVMGTRPVTYKMPRMITKTRPKVRHEVIEDCLNLNSGQMNAALYGAVQCLMAKVEAQAVTIAALQTKVGE